MVRTSFRNAKVSVPCGRQRWGSAAHGCRGMAALKGAHMWSAPKLVDQYTGYHSKMINRVQNVHKLRCADQARPFKLVHLDSTGLYNRHVRYMYSNASIVVPLTYSQQVENAHISAFMHTYVDAPCVPALMGTLQLSSPAPHEASPAP